MTTERDLIQRLVDALHDAAEDVEGWGNYASSYFQEKHDLPGNIAKIHAQAEEARVYLDQPEPEGPTEEELWELYDQRSGEPEDWPWIRDYARAVLARWGK